MKLIPVLYFGYTSVDKRFTSPMLPWIVSEIRRNDHLEKVCMLVVSLCFCIVLLITLVGQG